MRGQHSDTIRTTPCAGWTLAQASGSGLAHAMRLLTIPAVLAILLVTACSGATPPEPADPPSQPSEPPGTVPTATAPAATAPAAAAAPVTPPPTEAPVATRRAAQDGITFTLDLYPLRREGKSVLLTARLTAVEVPSGGAGIGDGRGMLTTVGQLTDPNSGIDNGFKLVDPAAQMVHLPARIDGIDACTRSADPTWKRGDARWVSCLFALPDTETDHLMVQAQTFGGFGDVPLR